MREASLYRCDVCGEVVRHASGETALGHIHHDEHGNYLGKAGEGRYIEFPDDGREGVPDLRDGLWLAGVSR